MMKRAKFLSLGNFYINHIRTSRKISMQVQHYHDSYEIYLQLDGKRYVFFDNMCYTLERGDMFILKPFDIHYAESRDIEHFERYVLNFQPDMLKPLLTDSEIHLLLEEKLEPCIIHLSDNEMADMTSYFKRADTYSKIDGFLADKLLVSAVSQLVIKVLDYKDKQSAITGEKIPPQVIDALIYINKHYTENISLDDISVTAHTSKYHLSKIFHEVTGATIFEYLNNVRLTRVHNLLINTKMTLDEIAGATGYMSAGNLTRAFKNIYGIPPREFRKLNQ